MIFIVPPFDFGIDRWPAAGPDGDNTPNLTAIGEFAKFDL